MNTLTNSCSQRKRWSFLCPPVVCIFLLLTLRPIPCALSQIPQGFNYQAIARDNSGNPIINTPLEIKLAVMADSLGGTVYWEELFNSVSTNAYGLFTVVMGQGVRQSASTVPTFSDLNWNSWPLFVRTQIYYQNAWKNMGSTKLWSVPYALSSKNALTANALSGNVSHIGVASNTPVMDSALFVVRNTTGQIVFAVYNEGVRIYVDDGIAKGTAKGGFAIGGFGTAKGTSQPYFVVSGDSIRGYIAPSMGKSVKGGFAIGGFGTTKGFSKYLNVTPDSTRIFTGDTIKGFGIGNISSGTAESYLKLTPKNYFIGHEAGKKITDGRFNSVIGYQSGTTLTTGSSNVLLGYQSGKNSNASYNTFLGYQAGYSNSSGNYNVFLGYQAGYNSPNTNNNTFLGFQAGYNAVAVNDLLREGSSNVFIGNQAGANVTTGMRSVIIGMIAGLKWQVGEGNIFIGYSAGSGEQSTTPTGQLNTFIGNAAASHLITGDDNVYIGDRAGSSNYYGTQSVIIGGLANYNVSGHYAVNNEVFIGYGAAAANSTGTNNTIIGNSAGSGNNGSYNVFLGNSAGANETGSNKLYVDVSNTSSPLIWGDFSSRLLNFNANVGIGTNSPGFKLDVIGRSRFQSGGGSAGFWLMNAANNTNRSFIGMYSDDYVGFYGTGGVNWGMVMNVNNGNLGIGTTAPGSKLEVLSDPSSSLQLRLRDATLNKKWDLAVDAGYEDGTNDDLYILNNAGTHVMVLTNAGTVGIGTNTPGSYKLYVNGSAYSTGGWASSDIRWKKNISPLSEDLNDIMKLQGVSYEWRRDEFPSVNFDSGTQIGLIAQEVEKVFPELVRTDDKGFKAVSYEKLSVILLEGMKEQQKQIDTYKTEIHALQEKVERIESLLENSNR